jgi:hypothetical protein
MSGLWGLLVIIGIPLAWLGFLALVVFVLIKVAMWAWAGG